MIRFLQDLVVRDFWLKLFSLALAALAWFTVEVALRNASPAMTGLPRLPAEKRTLPNLPVVILSSAEDVRSFRVNPKEVDVTVQGDGKVLRNLQPKDIRVIVDLTGIEAVNVLRRRIEVSTPAGVTHVKVEPEEVQVIFPPRN
jgi:YbbR domain-containing protein